METHNNTEWLASFDIGKKNFAFCIEEIQPHLITSLTRLPVRQRYAVDGTPTPAFHAILRRITANGRIVVLQHVDLTARCSSPSTTAYIDPQLFRCMTECLDEYKTYWARCSAFIVEQQMSFGKCRNTMALKLGQHCASYLMIHYPSRNVVDFPSYYKTKIVGAPVKLTPYQRKRWAVSMARDVLEQRGDGESLTMLMERAKKDDMADVIIQLQAYKVLVYMDRKKI